MPIKVKPRAFVAPEVLTFYQVLAEAKLREVFQKVKSANPHFQRSILKHNQAMIGRLSPIAAGKSEAGIGMDYELSRLRALDYDRIEIVDGYLVAKTRNLMVEELTYKMVVINRRRRIYNETYDLTGHWDVGPYWIYISRDDLFHSKMSEIHFIPQRKVRANSRHFHHFAYRGRLVGAEEIPEGIDPLTLKVNTCWSEFSEPLSSALFDGDLVEILRMLRIFVGRYYTGSPLRSPQLYEEMYEFMKYIPLEAT
jgi:hypothetical protein